MLSAAGLVQAAAPVVSNVRASQRAGAKLVDIYYNLEDSDTGVLSVQILVSADGGATWSVPAATFSGAVGGGVTPGLNKHVEWNAGADWDGQFTSRCKVRVLANDADPLGMALIPAGSFQMGDPFSDGNSDEKPVHTVQVNAFYLDRTEVTLTRWREVRNWAAVRNYTFSNEGLAKDWEHPVHTINWYDAVKWCNARSEKDNLTPVYYTDTSKTTIYKSGEVNLSNDMVLWSANGYRLPTEAEWEKAARGGLTGQRFPWGLTITHQQANYYSSTGYAYDTSSTRGYHPTYATGSMPYTSPVGSFPPTGYGLSDMAGNLWERCWDWYGRSYYSDASAGNNPRGPASGGCRVLRGGSCTHVANGTRCADRYLPDEENDFIGLRCARGL